MSVIKLYKSYVFLSISVIQITHLFLNYLQARTTLCETWLNTEVSFDQISDYFSNSLNFQLLFNRHTAFSQKR